MKKITLPSGEYLMVEVPKGVSNISFGFDDKTRLYYYPKDYHNSFDHRHINLPPDNYTLIGLCSEISEEEAKGIVEADSRTINNGENKILLSGFKDYKRVGGSSVFTVYKTATESLASLVRSNGMEVDTTVLLKINS